MLASRSLIAFAIVAIFVAVFACPDYVLGQTNSSKKDKKSAKKQAHAKEKGPSYTEAPKDDANFALMGEFLGKITEQEKSGLLGLQIRAIGQDRFEAIAYRGGLPGQPKFAPQPIHMIGQRSGDFVVLSGGPWAVFVDKTTCRLITRSGEKIGQLKRIKRSSPTLHAPAPEGATVVFDGSDTNQFSNGEMTVDGLLKEGGDLKPMFQDFNLHVEFRLPYMPLAESQQRSNSGLYLQSRYECQILDSFATVPVFNGMGALYRFKSPDVNMAFPPLTWQTYDVHFTAPRWAADGSKIRNAMVTSWVNGVKVQDNVSLPNKTGAGKTEEPFLLPIRLQDHGDPVRYRNVWVLDRGLAAMPQFPILTTKEQRLEANKAIQQRRQKRLKADRKKKVAETKAAKAKAAIKKAVEEALKKEAAKSNKNDLD